MCKEPMHFFVETISKLVLLLFCLHFPWNVHSSAWILVWVTAFMPWKRKDFLPRSQTTMADACSRFHLRWIPRCVSADKWTAAIGRIHLLLVFEVGRRRSVFPNARAVGISLLSVQLIHWMAFWKEHEQRNQTIFLKNSSSHSVSSEFFCSDV